MDERLIELAEQAQAEKLQQLLDSRVVYQGESATECEGCGIDIPEARRQAVPGCQLCVDCQGLRERSRV